VVKVKLFFYDFFLPYGSVNPVEFDLVRAFACPSFEHAKVQPSEGADRASLGGIGLNVFTGVVFLFHVYTLPHLREKARVFFTILQSIFVDNYPPIFEKNSYERLSFWSLGPIFKTLQPINPPFFYLSGYLLTNKNNPLIIKKN